MRVLPGLEVQGEAVSNLLVVQMAAVVQAVVVPWAAVKEAVAPEVAAQDHQVGRVEEAQEAVVLGMVVRWVVVRWVVVRWVVVRWVVVQEVEVWVLVALYFAAQAAPVALGVVERLVVWMVVVRPQTS